MSLKILGYTKDCRTNTPVVYAEILMKDYLDFVGNDFDRFDVQRKRLDPKKYTRLREDIKNGALLPGITLAIDHRKIVPFEEPINKKDSIALSKMLLESKDIYILDGLQRSFIIKDLLLEDKVEFKDEQKILLEIWFEKEIKHLIYRLIVLNSGQKPMSMKHQVEILFTTLKQNIEEDIPGLEIYLEKSGSIRSKAGKLSFDRIVNAYYSFTKKNPEIERDNLVAQKLDEEGILGMTEVELNEYYQSFIKYLKVYYELDNALFEIYDKNESLNSFKHWLAEENTINGFFAAVGKSTSEPKRLKHTDEALEKLLLQIRDGKSNDPLDLEQFKIVKEGIPSKKVNVGFGTRKLIMDGFREFFKERGDESFSECWVTSAT